MAKLDYRYEREFINVIDKRPKNSISDNKSFIERFH